MSKTTGGSSTHASSQNEFLKKSKRSNLLPQHVNVKHISRARFEALCYCRTPITPLIFTETEWYADESERVLGIVLMHLEDEDWAWTILGRDEKGLFRAIDLGTSMATRDEARASLHARLLHHAQTGETVFPQSDNDGRKNELLRPMADESRLHPIFNRLIKGEHFSSAREIIRELVYAFVDVDGNYAKDFQTSGFNARLWELYLFAFLHEQRFAMFREFSRPDFCVAKGPFRIGIEAVTVNQTPGERPPSPRSQDELDALRQQYMPIKFGSVLYSKLQKRYWELPHMQNVPVVLAVHDFCTNDSMTWSAPAINDYLFGLRASWSKDEGGKLHITEHPIKAHSWGSKTIPSGFFNQPNAEYISAVLFSNSGTLPKFNRMGKLAGFGSERVLMKRIGVMHNPDDNATEGLPFSVNVETGEYSEDWSHGVSVFLNPRAVHPIPPELFSGCAYHFIRAGRRVAMLPPFFVYTSRTLVVAPEDD